MLERTPMKRLDQGRMGKGGRVKSKKRIALIVSCGGVTLFSMVVFALFITWYARLTNYPELVFKASRGMPPESLDNYPIFSPKFETTLGTVEAGTAFLGKDTETNAVYMLTAHHLLGNAGGLSRDIEWDEVNEVLVSAAFWPITEGFEPIRLEEALVIEGAGPMELSYANDILAFRVDDAYGSIAIPFSSHPPPKVFKPIWLYAEVSGRDNHYHLALSRKVTDDWLKFFYDEALDLTATNGAPVVDHLGNLIGINLGASSRGEKLFGYANPLESIKKHLRKADTAREN